MLVEEVLAAVHATTGRVFVPSDVRVREREGVWIVELADAMVAFVAKDAAARARLLATRRILARIGPRLSFEVPRPLGPIERVDPCDVRTRTRGTVGVGLRDRVLRDADHAHRVATWLGEAMAELHASLASLELDALGVERPTWPPTGASLRRHVSDVRSLAVCVRWDALVAAPRDRRSDVLLHGDVDLQNVGVDPTTGLPVSIFDFHEAGRGSRAFDAKLLPRYGDAFLAAALASYAAKSGTPMDLAHVRLAHAATALASLGAEASDADRAWVDAAVSACG